MKNKLKKKLKDKSGAATLTALLTVAFVIILGFFVYDYMRAFTVQENLTEELYSIANNSIKGSMYTSFYFDQSNYFDNEKCEEMFYKALERDLKLKSESGCYYCYDNDGSISYVLNIKELKLNGLETNARMELKGEVFVQAAFLKHWYNNRGYTYNIYVKTKPIQTIGL